MDTPSITTVTEKVYAKRAELLLSGAERSLGRPWRDIVMPVSVHIANRRPEWSRSTWRTYRAALVWYLTREGFLIEAHYLAAQDERPCKRRTDKTSAMKLKSLPMKRLERAIDVLMNSKSQHDKVLTMWVLAGYTTGLRPGEWPHARLEGKTLVVRNAKSTNGRAFAPHRSLDLTNLAAGWIALIARFLEILAESGPFEENDQLWKTFYARHSKRLQRLNNELWPRRKKHITLYSGRHQFAADIKALECTPEELAALLGHASVLTAHKHYARRNVGRRRKGGRVRPSQDDVNKVAELNPGAISRLPFSTPAPSPTPAATPRSSSRPKLI